MLHLMMRPAESMSAANRLAQVNALLDEATDELLDMPEPMRTQFMKQLLEVREMVQKLKLRE